MAERTSKRLSIEAARTLWETEDVFALGRRAHGVRLALHPDPVVTYIVDRNINYTNICACGCRFCAFFRPPGHPEGYVLSRDELAAKVAETEALGGYQILLQGGMHPELHLDFYTGLLGFLRDRFPNVAVHGRGHRPDPGFAPCAGRTARRRSRCRRCASRGRSSSQGCGQAHQHTGSPGRPPGGPVRGLTSRFPGHSLYPPSGKL